MSRKFRQVIVRRLTGPRKTRLRVGRRAPAFYIAIVLLGSVAGYWLDRKIEQAEHSRPHVVPHAGGPVSPARQS